MEPVHSVVSGRPDDGVLGAPPGLEEEVGGLPFAYEESDIGGRCYISRWMPDEGERRLLAEGGSVLLRVYGVGHPPVSLTAIPGEAPRTDRDDHPPTPGRQRGSTESRGRG